MSDPNHDELDEPYEAIVAAQAMLEAASEILRGHEVSSDLTDISNRLNDERLRLLGNGLQRPFWVSELIAERTKP